MAVTLNETTLAAAVQPWDDRIKLTSAATVAPGQMAYAGKEAFLLIGLANPLDTTTYLVTRGYSGTPALSHASGAKIKTGPQGHFGMYERAGAGNANNEVALPWINVAEGDVYNISAGAWQQVGVGGVTQGTSAWP